MFVIDALYSFLVDGSFTVTVENYKCAVLGHGLKGPVIEHAFFGSKITSELKKMRGWDKGHVLVSKVTRNEEGLIVGLEQ